MSSSPSTLRTSTVRHTAASGPANAPFLAISFFVFHFTHVPLRRSQVSFTYHNVGRACDWWFLCICVIESDLLTHGRYLIFALVLPTHFLLHHCLNGQAGQVRYAFCPPVKAAYVASQLHGLSCSCYTLSTIPVTTWLATSKELRRFSDFQPLSDPQLW